MICALDLMTADVRTVSPALGIADLIAEWSRFGVSGFPVVDGRRPVGVVSRTDLLRRLDLDLAYAAGVGDFYRDWRESGGDLNIAEEGAIAGARLAKLRVKDIMTRRIVSVAPSDHVADVARTLMDEEVTRVLVVEGEALRGVLSATDVVRAVADGRLGDR